VPEKLADELRNLLADLGLDDAEPWEAIDYLTSFFRDNFEYTVYLDIAEGPRGDPVMRFLKEERRGHCEYFATSTVLLLRAAGIPARYVTGYSVSERAGSGDGYVVRGLHAHAWVQAWVDGQWHYVDTTPGGWLSIEREALTVWQPVSDWVSGFPVALTVWLAGPVGSHVWTFIQWASLPFLALYLWFRLFRGQRANRVRPEGRPILTRHGLDSPWYDLEPRLAQLAGSRGRGEPVQRWWSRVQAVRGEPFGRKVNEAIRLHYLLRFGESAHCDAEREELRRLVEACIGMMDSAGTDG
jgi:hypothetical protein